MNNYELIDSCASVQTVKAYKEFFRTLPDTREVENNRFRNENGEMLFVAIPKKYLRNKSEERFEIRFKRFAHTKESV